MNYCSGKGGGETRCRGISIGMLGMTKKLYMSTQAILIFIRAEGGTYTRQQAGFETEKAYREAHAGTRNVAELTLRELTVKEEDNRGDGIRCCLKSSTLCREQQQ